MKKNLFVPLFFALFACSTTAQETDLFGSNTENSGLSGFLYDLKSEDDGDVNDDVFGRGRVDVDETYDLIDSLSRKGFPLTKLVKFRQGDAHCYLKTVAIPNGPADAAPAAFGSPEIDPKAILMVYTGEVETAPAKRVRFAGRFDDLMMVLVNDEVVFYFGYYNDKIRYSKQELSERADSQIRDKELGATGGDAYGEYIQLRKGDKFQIVLAEIPGGHIAGTLKVQEENGSYKMDRFGDPILPPFVAGELDVKEKERLKAMGNIFDLGNIPGFTFVKK